MARKLKRKTLVKALPKRLELTLRMPTAPPAQPHKDVRIKDERRFVEKQMRDER